jgi:putative hydrolase
VADDPQPGDTPEDRDPTPGDPDPSSPGSMFPGLPGFPLGGSFDLSQMMRVLQSPGPVNWEVARQVATWITTEGKPEQPVDPEAHRELEDLAGAAQAHVAQETGLSATLSAPVSTLRPTEWATLHLDALKEVLEALAVNLGRAMQDHGELEPGGPDDPDLPPMSIGGLPPEMFGGILQMLAPALLGMQAGSMIGYLAQHSLGRYDLPLPTTDAPSLGFVVQNIDTFEEEWSLPHQDLRFYLAIHEVVHAAERTVPWVGDLLVRLAKEYVSGYEIDPDAFEARFGTIDPNDPASLSSVAEEPEALLGAMQSPAQDDARRRLQQLTAVLEGYADSVLELIGERLIPSFAQIHEAMKRHRVERGEAERFIEGLLGLKLDAECYEQGETFCRGVLERAGSAGLNRLWESERMLPTPAELDAPGLWLARIDLPDDPQ